ncbi:MAG TPA: polysaccharide deacetylase family protein [Lacibacter sp.]|nr:polysaccharide deacetylase family protein [Lacibacter sp.]
MRYIVTAPWWLQLGFPKGLLWGLPTSEKVIYFTFDDGPHPEATNFVLDVLKQYNAKATFFCIGQNVQLYPELYKRVLLEGHRTGNHTQHHLNGWETDETTWLNDVKQAAQWIDSDLFRPPYGKVTRFCAKVLQQSTTPFRIVMWNVLSADFDVSKSGSQCFENVRKHGKEGSIVVFHDSEKALPRLKVALPESLDYFTRQGFQFKSIS